MSSQRKDVDRYIPKRFDSEISGFNLEFDEEIPQYLLDDVSNYKTNENYFTNVAARSYFIANFQKKIMQTLNVRHHKILRAFPSEILKQTPRNAKRGFREPMWPVVSRKLPLINDPVLVLDMPLKDDLEMYAYRQIADWSRHGIASIFDGEIHIWNDDGNGVVQKSNTSGLLGDCVKWSPKGNMLGVTYNDGGVTKMATLEYRSFKIVEKRSCLCERCLITTITWCTSANIPVIGCSRGTITAFTGKPMHKVLSRNNTVTEIQFSCNDNFMLVALGSGELIIYKWPYLGKIHFVVRFCKRGLKSFSWHPWKESCLAVAENSGVVTLLNVNIRKIEASRTVEPICRQKFMLDFISFNPLSAELAVSFFHDDPVSDAKNFNIITVFRDLDTKVDEVRYHTKRVPNLMWDPTGKKLATLGNDECLSIWDFFGDKKTTTKYGRFERKDDNSKNFDGSPNFGACIR